MTKWPTVRLAEVAAVFNGKTPPKSEQRDKGHAVLKIRDVSDLGRFRGHFQSFVDADFARKFPNASVRTGDTLILNAAHNASYVASKTYHAEETTAGALATGEWLIIRADRSVIDPSFVHHWVNSQGTRTALRDQVKGIHLYPKDVARMAIPLPPLAEQRRIADTLDQADGLRSRRRAALEHLDILKKSIFLDMFASRASEDWQLTTIGSVAAALPGSLRTGPFGSQLLHGEFVDSGVAVLGIDNAVENEFRWAKPRYITPEKYKALARFTVHPGDVLITIMGTCGRCAIVPDNVPLAINTKHLCCITLDQTSCLPVFLHSYFLHHPLARRYLRQTAKGAVMDGLNMGIIRELPLRLPPLPLQAEYGRRMSAVEVVEVADRSSMSGFDDLFASLQDRAFRGEL